MIRHAALAVGAVAVVDECLLLVVRATPPGAGRWSLPGGRVEADETMTQAVERELLEETGLTGVCGPPIGCVERDAEGLRFVIVDFQVEVVSGVPRAASDAAAVELVPLGEVADRDLVDGLAEFLAAHGVIPELS